MQQTRLNRTDLRAIEYEAQQMAGEPPTLESLKVAGYRESTWQIQALRWIADTGRVVTLLIAETIQAGAALAIGGVFALLEYQRVYNGALALGQPGGQAALIAAAVVTANIITPIYALRGLRGQDHREIVRRTGRGFCEAFWRRLIGQPRADRVDLYHNPGLAVAAAVITWSTVLLAVYDLLRPLLEQLLTGVYTRPALIAALELLMGLGLSVAGVFFLQSAAHEIGVRTLTDQPTRLLDLLEQHQAEYTTHLDQVRADVRERYIAAKLADQTRAEDNEPVNPTVAQNGRNHSTAAFAGKPQG